MMRTPLAVSLIMAVLVTGSLLLSACKPQPTVDEATPESEARFEMVNGVLMRVNELPDKDEVRQSEKHAEFEKVRQQVLENHRQNQ